MEDLITLYRGQPWFGPSRMLNFENQGYRASNRFVNPLITGLDSFKNLTKDDLARLSGQYWTDSPGYAGTYAGSTGKIKSMNIPSSDLDKFSRFENKVTRLPSGKYVHAGNPAGAYLVPKSTLTKYNPKLNVGRTIQNLAKDFDYPFKHGLPKNPITKLMDEGRILKAGWDLYEDATLGERLSGVGKHISKSGLAFLRNNALKGLGILGSLPAQAGIMTLSPTHLGMDDVPDWHKTAPTAPPSIKNPGGGNGGYQGGGGKPGSMPTGTAGRNPWGRADGGLINLYRYGGFI